MKHVSIYEAKNNLSRLIKAVCAGEDIVICKAGLPLALLSPYKKNSQKRKPGLLKGKIKITKDFDNFPEDFKIYFN